VYRRDPLALSALHVRSMKQKEEGATSAIDAKKKMPCCAACSAQRERKQKEKMAGQSARK